MWVSRSCRPGIAYPTSVSQSAVSKPVIVDIVYANATIQYVRETPKRGLVFRHGGVEWPSRAHPEVRLCIAAVSDASHGSEDEYLDDWDEREPFRSQGAKLIFLASKDILGDSQAGWVHLVSCASTTLKRVVSSTMKAVS